MSFGKACRSLQEPRCKNLALVVLAVTTLVVAQGFKVYSSAKKLVSPETKESKEALASLPPGTEINSYPTDDPFEKVEFRRTSLG
jgi:hypothetical protein